MEPTQEPAQEPVHEPAQDLTDYENVIYFYKVSEEPYGCFSNFAKYGLELDGAWWPTSEHYFQAKKFLDPQIQAKIRLAATPKQSAEMGRDRSNPLRPDWEAVKDEIMRQAVLKKFQTHPEIKAILLATGTKHIVENAPGDYYWGCGKDGTGKNMLGQILVEVRDLLKTGEE